MESLDYKDVKREHFKINLDWKSDPVLPPSLLLPFSRAPLDRYLRSQKPQLEV